MKWTFFRSRVLSYNRSLCGTCLSEARSLFRATNVGKSIRNSAPVFNCTQGGPKKLTPFVSYGFLYALISSNIDRFSNLFHCLNQETICNNTVAKDPTTPQVCRYTTL